MHAADERALLAALRLAALGIAHPASADPASAVRSLLALQAQDYPGTLWAIGLRTPGSTAASVDAAHEAGGFVRSWPMRGTLHVTAPEDLVWMLGLTGERQARTASGRHRQLELSESDFARAEEVARRLLAGGAHLERSALLAALDAAGVSTAGQRGAHLLGNLAHTGVVVLSGQKTFALLDEWVTGPRALDRDAALAELALRYFHSHGPATVRDLAWWSGLPLGDVRAGLAAVRGRLAELVIDGVEYLHRPELEPAPAAVHLLPGFDEYLLGYADRSSILPPEHADAVVPGGNGMFLSSIVVDGEIVGTWRRDRSTRRVAVTLQPFRELTPGTLRGVRRALDAYSDFVGLPVELQD